MNQHYEAIFVPNTSKGRTEESNHTPSLNDPIGQSMANILSHRYVLVVVFVTIYILSILYMYLSCSTTSFWLNIAIIVLQMVINKANIKTTMTPGEHFSKSDALEKARLLISLLFTTVRYYILPKNKILFIPTMFMWLIGANKMYIDSQFWGLLPSCYLIVLFALGGVYRSMMEYLENGLNDFVIDFLIDDVVLSLCLLVFSYYLINVTGYLKQKVMILEETSRKLEHALQVCC